MDGRALGVVWLVLLAAAACGPWPAAGADLGGLQTGFVTFYDVTATAEIQPLAARVTADSPGLPAVSRRVAALLSRRPPAPAPVPAPAISQPPLAQPPPANLAALPAVTRRIASLLGSRPPAPAPAPALSRPAPAPASVFSKDVGAEAAAPAAAAEEDTSTPALSVGGALVSGACGYGELQAADWPYNEVVALSPVNPIVSSIGANKGACGQCIRATCTSSNCALNSSSGVVLWVTDTCDGCDANQLNVPSPTFLRHFGASLGLGRVNVSFQQVDCNPPGNIRVKVSQARADGGGYLALTLLSVAGTGMLAGVDIKTSGSQTWAPMSNSYGNVWQASQFGAAPLDLRVTSAQGVSLIARGVITEIANATFPTTIQFGPTAPALAPSIGAIAARPPAAATLPVLAPQPNPYRQASPPAVASLGQRVNVPLYYAPPDLTALGFYPGLVFAYAPCTSAPPSLNLTINRLRVPGADGNAVPALALHTLLYRPVRTRSATPIYRIVDYTFFNLETGELARLYQPVIASFDEPALTGFTQFVDLDTLQPVAPRYYAPSDLNGPADFDYTVLLPPGPNQAPTASYLAGLTNLFYLLSTLALGNPGTDQLLLTCSPGYPQVGSWADYVRGILAQLAPPDQISADDLYRNVPLNADTSFQDTSFVLGLAAITGNTVNTTKQLSSRDCGASCRPRLPAVTGQPLCSAWSWCGSISGCGNVPYQTCVLLNSTVIANTTAPSGFINLQRNGSTRLTSGVLVLPPPTGVNLFTLNDTAAAAPVSDGPAAAVNYGLMAGVTAATG